MLSSIAPRSSRSFSSLSRLLTTPPTQPSNTTIAYTEFHNQPVPVRGTLPYNGIGLAVGQYAEINRLYTEDDLIAFGRLTGDYNPIHYTPSDNMVINSPSLLSGTTAHSLQPPAPPDAITPYPRIVHGLLLASLFPTVLSSIFPNAIYRSQKLKWHAPLPCNDHVLCRVDLTKITPLKKRPQMLLQFDTLVIRAVDGQVVVSGEGEVYLKQGGMLIGDSVMEGGEGEDEDDLR